MNEIDRRSKAWRELIRLAGIDPEAAAGSDEDVEEIEGLQFDYRREPRCHVCAAEDPERALPNGITATERVDAGLVGGRTYADIHRDVEPLMTEWPPEERITYASIRRHAMRHLGVDLATIRAIVERRAAQRGLEIVRGRSPLVTTEAVLEVVRQRGFEEIVARSVKPSVRETIDASRLLDEIDAEAGRMLTPAMIAAQVRAFVEFVRSRVPAETWAEIVEAMGEAGPATPSALPPAEKEGEGGA